MMWWARRAGLSVFTELPKATSLDEIEVLLPHNMD